MPLPTTRRERYLWRRAKYRYRAYRSTHCRKSDNAHNHIDGHPWYKAPRYHCVGDGTLQGGPGIVHTSLNWEVPVPPHVAGDWYSITRLTPASAWRVKIDPPIMYGASPTTNARFPLVGFFRRRQRYNGHKIGRLTGVNRLRALAKLFYMSHEQQGYPEWDPDHREPVWIE